MRHTVFLLYVSKGFDLLVKQLAKLGSIKRFFYNVFWGGFFKFWFRWRLSLVIWREIFFCSLLNRHAGLVCLRFPFAISFFSQLRLPSIIWYGSLWGTVNNSKLLLMTSSWLVLSTFTIRSDKGLSNIGSWSWSSLPPLTAVSSSGSAW